MNFRDRSLVIRFLLDAASLVLAFGIAIWLSHNFHIPVRRRDFLHLGILLLGLFQFADSMQYYHNYRLKNVTHDLLTSVRMTGMLLFIYAAVGFLVDTGGNEQLGILAFLVVLFPLLFLRKYVFRRFTMLLGKGWKERVLFVGNTGSAKEISDIIRRNPYMGYINMGRVDIDRQEYDIDEIERRLFEKLNELESSRVFIDEKSLKRGDLDRILTLCLSHTVVPYIIPAGLKYYSERYQVQFFNDIPIVAVRKNPLERFRYKALKRVFDILFALALLLTVLPVLFFIIAVLIKMDSNGPVFFVQKRWGMNNAPFNALKFRSMSTRSSDVVDGKYQQAQRNDPRITKVGAILRKTNLDELPQFVNVLLGDMSIVGPRPHPEPLNLESKDVVNNYLQRHLVKPGITGWAQVNGARGETRKVSQMQKRVDYDIWYIENWSFMLDIRIIFQTVWNMYKGEQQAF